MAAQMIKWNNNNVRTVSESRLNQSLSGEPHRSPLFVFIRLKFGAGVTGGVTKWGYILAQLGLHIWGNWGGDRGVEKYRFFKIDPRFSHFTIKKIPSLCEFAPY